MIYIAKVKKHWFSITHKVEFSYKENAVDYCRRYTRMGWWGKVIEKKGGW